MWRLFNKAAAWHCVISTRAKTRRGVTKQLCVTITCWLAADKIIISNNLFRKLKVIINKCQGHTTNSEWAVCEPFK